MGSTVQRIEDEIADHTSVIAELHQKLRVAKGNEYFLCVECNKRTKIKSVSLIRKYRYNHTNAGSGSYWSLSEYQIYCPKCTSRTRMLGDEWREWTEYRKPAFLECLDWCPSSNTGMMEFSLGKLRMKALNQD